MAISANEYNNLGCQDARAEVQTAQAKEFALSRRQNNAALADAASVFLFLLPLGSVFGADVSGELAQAKGESFALRRRAALACSVQGATGSFTATRADPAAAAPSQQMVYSSAVNAMVSVAPASR
jgi:hypothetical protein